MSRSLNQTNHAPQGNDTTGVGNLLERLNSLLQDMITLSCNELEFEDKLQDFQQQQQQLEGEIRQVLPIPLPAELQAPVEQVQQSLKQLQQALQAQQSQARESIMSVKGFKKARKAYQQF